MDKQERGWLTLDELIKRRDADAVGPTEIKRGKGLKTITIPWGEIEPDESCFGTG